MGTINQDRSFAYFTGHIQEDIVCKDRKSSDCNKCYYLHIDKEMGKTQFQRKS